MDANKKDVTTIEGRLKPGFGNGFSAFLGLSEKNTIWIAEFSQTANAIKTETVKKIEFKAGDCLIMQYGSVHRGDLNDTGRPSYKVFTDVNSGKAPGSTSQLWVIEGEGGGWSSLKPK